jgi:hypothetical protein
MGMHLSSTVYYIASGMGLGVYFICCWCSVAFLKGCYTLANTTPAQPSHILAIRVEIQEVVCLWVVEVVR